MFYKNFEVPTPKGKNIYLVGIFLFFSMSLLFILISWMLNGFVWNTSGSAGSLIIAFLLTIIAVSSKNGIDAEKKLLFVRNINHPLGRKVAINNIITITETKNKSLWGWVDAFVVKTADGKTVKASVVDLKAFVAELKSINPKIGVIKG